MDAVPAAAGAESPQHSTVASRSQSANALRRDSRRRDSPASNEPLTVPERAAMEHSKLGLEELKSATISSADKFYKLKQHQQVLDVLLAGYEKLPQEAEIVWRLCRAYFDLSEMQPKESRKEYLEVGFQFADKGLAIDKNNALFYKWWAIFCSLLGDYQPTKEKIGNAFKIKEHAMKANELAPGDPTTLHLLGRWCYSVASITWIERTAAAALFGTPPSSSYEEALGYFMKAAAIDEKFIRNLIFIGDCHVAMKKYADAKTWYRKAADAPFDDKVKAEVAYHEEAETKWGKYKGY